MKLVQALEILQRQATADAPAFTVSLACGFEPLHLHTFLAAELAERPPGARVEVHSGLFDDLLGNIQRAGRSGTDAVAVVIEWPDLDPRLGVRRLGGWRVPDLGEIVAEAELVLGRLERELTAAATVRRVVCCLPTLPLPPVFPEPPERSGAQELALRSAVAAFTARLARQPGLSVASGQQLDQLSPPADRRDVSAELNSGFPYAVQHASVIATLLAELLRARAPKKGLITDLDNTLWSGTLDEVGARGVSWTGDGHRHGLYQQLLASLASAGVLVAVASRNDPGLVADALHRRDMLITPDAVFPVEARWGPKSVSIGRILEAWNVGADAVVFVDDSPLELDQARDAFPGLQALAIPDEEDAMWPFMTRLRGLFGKGEVTVEDGLRLDSIRSAGALHEARQRTSGAGDFLAGVGGAVEFSRTTARWERALELINKSNQFNLNGRRLTEADMAAVTRERDGGLVSVSYADRYGPLGMVAALVVSPRGGGLEIDVWAMSCRAFARRVEHHTLRYLFDRFGAPEITMAFHRTGRNLALQEFLASVLGETPGESPRLTLADFEQRAPALVHRVVQDAP
jgi:FkbH-like protein